MPKIVGGGIRVGVKRADKVVASMFYVLTLRFIIVCPLLKCKTITDRLSIFIFYFLNREKGFPGDSVYLRVQFSILRELINAE